MRARKQSKGFTLIELMIIVAIIGILAAIAYPSYRDSIYKSRRADGQSALLNLQHKMEKFRGWCAHYPQNLGSSDTCGSNSSGTTINVGGTSLNSTDGHYIITIATGTASNIGYTLKATPTGAQAGDSCTEIDLVVDNSHPQGNKTPSNCWQ